MTRMFEMQEAASRWALSRMSATWRPRDYGNPMRARIAANRGSARIGFHRSSSGNHLD